MRFRIGPVEGGAREAIAGLGVDKEIFTLYNMRKMEKRVF
jgi:hypothetical protein